jgi:glycerate kinase
LAAGLIGTIGGQIESGAALVGEIVHLDEAIRDADLVVTGEGKLDEQTTFGKTVAHVLARCTALERPCLVVAGSADQRPSNLSDLAVVASNGITVEEAMTRAPELVAEATERLLLTYMEG